MHGMDFVMDSVRLLTNFKGKSCPCDQGGAGVGKPRRSYPPARYGGVPGGCVASSPKASRARGVVRRAAPAHALCSRHARTAARGGLRR